MWSKPTVTQHSGNAALGGTEKGTKFFYGSIFDFVLDVEVMLGHADVRMADQCLDCGHVHAFGLELAHVGVSAAVRRQQPHALHLAERILEVLAEAAGIHRASRNTGAFPDVGFAAVVPEGLHIGANLNGNGNVPDAVLALRGADVRNTRCGDPFPASPGWTGQSGQRADRA